MKKITLNNILIFSILLIMFLPIIDNVFHLQPRIKLTEKRKLVKKPKTFDAKKFDEYINDNFGMRSSFILLRNQLKYSVFQDSPNLSRVILGKEDWLYYAAMALEDYRGEKLYTQKELGQIKEINEARQKFLNDRGIKFYITIAPNKHSIYPEYLPEHIKRLNEGKYNQLKKYLKENSSLNLIDIHEPILKAKEHYPDDILYNKYDTHWSDLGAFVAHEKLIDEIGKDFPAILKNRLKLEDFKYKFTFRENRNNAGQMQLIKPVRYVDKEFEYNKEPSAQLVEPYTYKGFQFKQRHGFWAKKQNNPQLPSVLVFRDSFYTRLEKFFSEYFNKSVYVWKNDSLRLDIIEEEKPDIVVLEIVERLKDKLQTQPYTAEDVIKCMKSRKKWKKVDELGVSREVFAALEREYRKMKIEDSKNIRTL